MNLRKILVLVSLVFVATSCEDYLDKNPTDSLSAEGYFVSEEAAESSRIGLYATSPGIFTDAKFLWDCITDQMYATYNNGSARSISRGLITTETGGLISSMYNDAYVVISRANDHISSVSGMSDDLFNDLSKEHYLADARFLKAYYYYYLTETYGGVPLYKEKIETIEGHYIKQSPKVEIVDYILSELDLAIAALPETGYSGYITRGTAQALKTRILLQNKRWQEAADEAEKIINSGQFSLDANYFEVFTKAGQPSSNEIMFSYQYLAPNRTHGLGRRLTRSVHGTPRQEFVDAYLMSDGLSVADSPLDGSDYQNRDPRFYETVYAEDDPWVVDLNVHEATLTNWYVKKFIDPDTSVTTPDITDTFSNSDQDIIQIRYADVLLMYAEAKHMLNQFDQGIYDNTIKLIRDRVGMSNVDLSAMTADEKLDLIKYERSVELAFEGHRYFDLKRWGTLGDVMTSLVDPQGITIVWEDKFLLWPFRLSELRLNENLDQNPGYDE